MAGGSVAEVPLSALEEHYSLGSLGAAGTSPGVTLSERRCLVILRLAAPRADKNFAERVQTETGFELPFAPNKATLTAAGSALWTGPDEWLLTSDRRLPGHEQALRRCLAGPSGAVVDLSHARIVLRIAGEHSRDLLARGCSLDLHPRKFAAGECAQSLLGQVSVLLHRREAETFDLFVARSYAVSVWDWLTGAAAGFGYVVLPADSGTNGADV